MGNSITQGYPFEPGYREFLYNNLSNEGIDFEFVGPDGAVPYSGLFMSGAKIEDFYEGETKDFSNAINLYKPNMVLIHLGTNNYSEAAAPYSNDNGNTLITSTASGKLAKVLKQISKYSGIERIVLCKIISQKDNGSLENPQVDLFNAEIDRIFFDRPPGISVDKMTIVDMKSALDISNYYDDRHPNQTGYGKMADEFTRIIKGIDEGDDTAPGEIAWIRGEVLNKQNGSIQLEWRAPGDDNYTNRANLYELRYAEYPLVNFSDGILVPGLAVPGVPYSSDSKIITGLIPGITYYFYIRAYDELNNSGPVSDEQQLYIEPNVIPEYSDDFSDPALSALWWDFDPTYQIINEELVNTNPSEGWNNLATYKRAVYSSNAEYIETSFKYTKLGDVGIAMMLDDSTTNASGYFIYIRSNKLRLYAITNGSIYGTDKIDDTDISIIPDIGDILIVQCFPNSAQGHSFEVSLYNENIGTTYVGKVYDLNKLRGDAPNLYSGVMLYSGYNNAIDDFSIKIPPLPAYAMEIYDGDNESGRVTKKLAKSLTVRITDINELPVPGTPVDFQVTSGSGFLSTHPDSIERNFNNNIWVEAESGDLLLPMAKQDDLGASGNRYIVVVPATDELGNGNNGQGSANYKIYIPVEGNYRLWLRVLAPTGNNNSCYISVNGSPEYQWSFEFHPTAWKWKSPESQTHSFSLPSGFIDFTIRNRESGTKIDKILLTRNASYTPSGEGDDTQPFSFITNASGLARTEITFGQAAGPVEVTAEANVPNGSPQTFHIYAHALDPGSMEYNSPQSYPGVAGNPLDIDFSVFLKDDYNNPCSGIPVDFIITAGDGSFNGNGTDSTRLSTESDGTANIRLTLGYQQETTVKAVLPDFPEIPPLEFHGIAGEGIPVSIQVTKGQDQVGTVRTQLTEPLEVLILDEKSEPVENYPVPFEIIKGNGLLDNESGAKTVKTNAYGKASVTFTLGDTSGVSSNVVRIDVPLPESPVYFRPKARPDSPYQLLKIAGDLQQQNAGKMFDDTLVVRVTDKYNNGIGDYLVKFAVQTGDGNFSGNEGTSTLNANITLTTDSSGTARISYTAGSQEGENIITATGLPALQVGSPANFTLTVLPRKPNKLIKRSGDNPQQVATVNSLLSSPFKVRILDPFGNNMNGGIKVIFKVLNGGGKFSSLDSAIVESNTDGEAEATLRLGTLAGTQSVKVYLLNYPDVPSVTFNAIATPGPAAKMLTAIANPFTYKAGYSPIPLQIKITDQYDNPKPGHQVEFKITQGNGQLEGGTSPVNVNSNNQGIATVNFKLGTNVSVINLVTATSYKVNSQQQLTGSPYTFRGFVTPDTAHHIVKISGDNPIQQAPIGSVLPDSFVIQIRDQYNNPVPAQMVTFEALCQDGRIGNNTILDRTTDDNGEAFVFYTLCFKAGESSDSVSVYIKNRSDINPVLFTATALPGMPENIFAYQDSIWANLTLGSNPIQLSPKALVTDIRYNPTPNADVLFKVVGDNSLVNGKDSVKVKTNQTGIAQVTWTLNAKPDSNIIYAYSTYNGAPLFNSPVKFIAVTKPGVPFLLERVSAENDTGVANQRLSNPIVVRVTDQFHNPISKHSVLFSVTYPANGNKGKFILEDNSLVESVSVTTNDSGRAQVYFKPVTGINSAMASSEYNGKKLLSDQVFYINGTPALASEIRLLSDKKIIARTSDTLTVRVGAYDMNGGPVDKQTINFNILKGNGYLETTKTEKSFTSTRNGIAEEKWVLGTKAGIENRLEISSTNDQVHLNGSPDTVIVTLLPGRPDPDSSLITATSNIRANGTDYSIVTITLRDRFNNPVPDILPVLHSDNEGVTIENPQSPTNSNGQTTGKVRSTSSADTVSVTVIIPGVPQIEICCAKIIFIPDIAAKIQVFSGQSQTGNKGAVLKQPFTARVTDNNNNPVSGVDIYFQTDKGNGYSLVSGQQSFTVKSDANGKASCYWVLGPNTGENTINVTIKNLGQNSPKAIFRAQARTAQPPYSMFKVSGDSLRAVVGDTLSAPLISGLIDSDSIAVAGLAVTFESLSGDGVLIGANPVTSDHSGFSAIKYKLGLTYGFQFVEAKAEGADKKLTFTVIAQSDSAIDILAVSQTTFQDTVGKILPDSLIVRAVDENDNPVSGVPVLFHITDAPGDQHNAQLLGPDTVYTNTSGLAKTRFKIGQIVGDYVVTAVSPDIKEKIVVFQFEAVHGKPARLVKNSGDEQYMTKNRFLVYPVVVLVTDIFGNPVENEVVYFQPKDFIGSVSSPRDTTDNFGLGRCYWQLGDQAENTLWASKPGTEPNHVEFHASGIDNNFPEFTGLSKADTVDYTNGEYKVEIFAQDADNDPLTYSILSKPDNAVFNPATRLFSWVPKSYQKKTWHIVFRVEDNKTGNEKGFDVDSLMVTVTGNLPPKIISYYPANLDIDVGENKTEKFIIVAIDPDGDQMTYTWYVDNTEKGSGTEFIFKAAENPGVHSVTCRISDGQETVNVKWDRVTKIELQSFSAAQVPYKGVSVNWTTRSEENNLGFFIYRNISENGEYEKLNDKILPPRTNGEYTFIDTTASAGRKYYYKLIDISASGLSGEHGPVMLETSLPKDFQIYQNFPNPFNPWTKIRFELPKQELTQITIYNITGQVVKTLVNDQLKPGYHEVVWDGLNDQGLKISSGVYYYRIQAGSFKQVKKMALIK
ncbi:Ig-like domain-containing protein [candidate division KSB1 bacterium]|nr:Ig-like domain-containing protein [candidate division KSB1 bacterium]